MNTTPRIRSRRQRAIWLLPLAALGVGGALAGVTTPASSKTPAAPLDGIANMCDNGSVSTDASEVAFTLTAKTGQIYTADGNTVPMWGYAPSDGAYQYPSPFLCVTQGKTVTVVLRNTLSVPTSIMFPGQHDVLANGVPVQPELSGLNITSMVPSVGAGQTITYSFVANQPGSFLYQSGTNPALQEQMGLFGGLIVRPKSDTATSRTLYGDARSAYQPDREFVQMLSDVDASIHADVFAGRPADMSSIRPEYFFINGRSMPDTVAPNLASWMPNQPYSGLVHVLPLWDPTDEGLAASTPPPANGSTIHIGYNSAAHPGMSVTCVGRCYDSLPAAIRYFNAREKTSPFHPHSADTIVEGFDGVELTANDAAKTSLAVNHYLVNLAPGQTADSVWSWRDRHEWNPVSRPGPVPVHDFRDTRYTAPGSWYGGTPYLGVPDDLPDGLPTFNECGEYYSVAHNHAVNEATTYGAAMGGMLTLYRIDPPGMWYCGKQP